MKASDISLIMTTTNSSRFNGKVFRCLSKEDLTKLQPPPTHPSPTTTTLTVLRPAFRRLKKWAKIPSDFHHFQVSALTVMSTTHAPGEAPHIEDVKDQRLSGLTVSVMLGFSVLMAPVLKQVRNYFLFFKNLYWSGILCLRNMSWIFCAIFHTKLLRNCFFNLTYFSVQNIFPRFSKLLPAWTNKLLDFFTWFCCYNFSPKTVRSPSRSSSGCSCTWECPPSTASRCSTGSAWCSRRSSTTRRSPTCAGSGLGRWTCSQSARSWVSPSYGWVGQ